MCEDEGDERQKMNGNNVINVMSNNDDNKINDINENKLNTDYFRSIIDPPK